MLCNRLFPHCKPLYIKCITNINNCSLRLSDTNTVFVTSCIEEIVIHMCIDVASFKDQCGGSAMVNIAVCDIYLASREFRELIVLPP